MEDKNIRFNIKYKKYTQTYRMPKYIYNDFITYVLEDKKRHKTNSKEFKQQKAEVQNSIQNILNETKHFRQMDNFTYYFNKLVYDTIALKIKDIQKENKKLEEYKKKLDEANKILAKNNLEIARLNANLNNLKYQI